MGVSLEDVDAEAGASCGSDWGDWLILGVVRGVLNAPVDRRCSSSKISWSSFGRRGGAGESRKDLRRVAVVEKVRDWGRDDREARRRAAGLRREAILCVGQEEKRQLSSTMYSDSDSYIIEASQLELHFLG